MRERERERARERERERECVCVTEREMPGLLNPTTPISPGASPGVRETGSDACVVWRQEVRCVWLDTQSHLVTAPSFDQKPFYTSCTTNNLLKINCFEEMLSGTHLLESHTTASSDVAVCVCVCVCVDTRGSLTHTVTLTKTNKDAHTKAKCKRTHTHTHTHT